MTNAAMTLGHTGPLPDVGVLGGEGMTILAMRLRGAQGGEGYAAQYVFSVVHDLKVVRVDAAGVATEVVELQTSGNLAVVCQFIREAMGVHIPPSYFEGPVPALPLLAGLPFPTVRRLLDLRPEARCDVRAAVLSIPHAGTATGALMAATISGAAAGNVRASRRMTDMPGLRAPL